MSRSLELGFHSDGLEQNVFGGFPERLTLLTNLTRLEISLAGPRALYPGSPEPDPPRHQHVRPTCTHLLAGNPTWRGRSRGRGEGGHVILCLNLVSRCGRGQNRAVVIEVFHATVEASTGLFRIPNRDDNQWQSCHFDERRAVQAVAVPAVTVS